MSRYSISDAVFFATKHDKKSKHFRRLAITYILLKIVFFAVLVAIAFPFMSGLGELFSGDLDPQVLEAELVAPISLLSNIQSIGGLLFLPFFMAVMGSFYRWAVNDDWSSKGFGLRFGNTELHLFLVYLVVYIIIILATLALIIPFSIVMSIQFAASDEFSSTLVAVAVLGGFAIFWIWIWLAIKLSLAAALTVRHGEIKIFESFAATKGHFWKLFFSNFLFIIMYIVILVIFMIAMLIISLPFIGVGMAIFGTSPAESDYILIAVVAAIPIALLIIAALWIEFWGYAASAGIGAYFLRWKEGDPVEKVAKEFE
ncbi:MAG: hypothetical protein JKY46_12210 [Robiginitomaculum sp.]|nr:hypothetical protein [Robiginitomaculum sp.]